MRMATAYASDRSASSGGNRSLWRVFCNLLVGTGVFQNDWSAVGLCDRVLVECIVSVSVTLCFFN